MIYMSLKWKDDNYKFVILNTHFLIGMTLIFVRCKNDESSPNKIHDELVTKKQKIKIYS